MNRWLFCIALSCLASSVSSAPVSVRSGDHPNFVRMVIDIPIGADWEVGRVNDGFAIKVEGIAEYETADVFSRISTSRITRIESQVEPNQLVLFSDCDCHATAFLWKPNKLVVDINNGQAPIGSKFETRLAPKQETLVLPVLTSRPLVLEKFLHSPAPAFDFSERTEDLAQLDDLEQIVVESLARAATQGLLAPSINLKSVESIPIHFDAHIARNQPGLLAHTSIDLGTIASTKAINSPGACLSQEYFAVSEWITDQTFADRVTQARARIAGEFDKADPDSVIELARTYLLFGFGRETWSALHIDGEKSREREILILMGAIVDGDKILPTMLEAQLECGGGEALWAFLAQPIESKAKGNRNGILREFRLLPLNLQNLLGPVLSDRFRKVGDFDAAEMLLSANFDGLDQTLEATIAQTELLTDLGKHEEATEILGELAASDSRITPEALVGYLTLAPESELGVDPEAIALGDILRYENKGSAVVGDLAAAQVTALIAIDDLNAAFQLLDDESEAIGALRKSDLTSAAVLSATNNYEEAMFLEFAFTMDFENVTAEAQNAVASRLLALGLPERAAKLVDGPATGTAMMERRYLRAQADVEVGEGEMALSELAGLSTEHAEKLRSQIELVASGREEISLVAFGDDWKLGNWAALSQSDDTLLQGVSRAMLNEVEILADSGEPLAEGRRLLTQSSEMRELLGELLFRFEMEGTEMSP